MKIPPPPSKQMMHRVLIVEDDYHLADTLCEVLTFENCLVDVAANGMEARDKLRSADYDAIVCDLIMPMIDGEALYNDVAREFPYLADKFLFITGHASAKGGFTSFIWQTGNTLLEKPFEMDQFCAALRDVFKR